MADGTGNEGRTGHARGVLAALHALLRAVKLYDPRNAVFEKPLAALRDCLLALMGDRGGVELAVVGQSLYLDGELVRLDHGSAAHARDVIAEMRSRQVGGLRVSDAPDLDDLRNFVWMFAKDQTCIPSEDGVPGHELKAVRIRPWAALEERLDAVEDDPVARRSYPFVLYARAAFLLRRHVADLQAGVAAQPGGAARLVEDLIDAFPQHGNELVSALCTGDGEDETLVFHLVNTAVLVIAFARALGLPKVQTKHLALAALLDEAAVCRLPSDIRLASAPERLEPAAQEARARARAQRATELLAGGGGAKRQLRALSLLQMHEAFSRLQRDAQGRAVLVERADILYSARILALCSYLDVLLLGADGESPSPAAALDRIWHLERWRFDPELAATFVRVMAGQPLRRRFG